MSAPGYGHNSGAVVIDAAQEIARLQTRVVTLENELAAAQRDRAEAIRKRDDLQRKKDSSDRIIASDLPPSHKLVTVRMINATDDHGVGHVKRKLLAQAASVKSLEYISKVVRELKAHGVVRQVDDNSPFYQVPSLVDLQQAVEMYAANKGKQSVHPYTPEHPPYSVEHPPCPTEHPPCSTEYGYTRTLQDTDRAPQDTPRAPQSTLEVIPIKGSPPLGPPPFPHTPFPPPIIPPTPKNLVPTERPEQVDSLAVAKKIATSDARGSRLPADWQPDEALLAWASTETRLPADRVRVETENFRDHWHAKAGADARKVLWGATWKKWMRKASDNYVNEQQRAARYSGKPAPTLTPKTRFWWEDDAKVAAMTPERWREGIAKHANGTWDVRMLSPPPGDPKCRVPRSLIAEMRLEDIYDHNGFKRETRR